MGGVVNCVAGCMVATDIIIHTAPRGSGGGAKYPEPHLFCSNAFIFIGKSIFLMYSGGFALSTYPEPVFLLKRSHFQWENLIFCTFRCADFRRESVCSKK